MVVWCSKEIERNIEEKLRTLQDKYFYDAIPLFTEKIHKGIGKAYSPKKNSEFHKIMRAILKKKDKEFSYGSYMAYLLALAMQTFVRATFPGVEKFSLKRMEDHSRIGLGIHMIYFARRRMAKDLDI